MSTITKLNDINVYQDSLNLVTELYKYLNSNTKLKREFSLLDQMKRCCVSIPSNISEGFERGTKKEFIHFLFISKGSCSELITQLHICNNLNLITKDEFMLFESQADKILRKLGSFIKYLKTS